MKLSQKHLVFGVAALLWTAFAPCAFAHAVLVKAEPARRASLSEAPRQIRLWFNEEIEGAYASVTVLDDAGKAASIGKPSIAEGDRKSVVLDLPALAPSNYTVKYRVLSVDGHVVESSYGFTVKAKGPGK
jgi:copper resistance protein C